MLFKFTELFTNPFWKKRKHRTLADIDKMTMSQINELLGEQDEMENVSTIISKPLICKKCGGELFLVEPKLILGDKELYQCVLCSERIYK